MGDGVLGREIGPDRCYFTSPFAQTVEILLLDYISFRFSLNFFEEESAMALVEGYFLPVAFKKAQKTWLRRGSRGIQSTGECI